MDEIPAVGDTTESARVIDITTPDASGTLWTVGEVVAEFRVSASTVKRRIAAGDVAGASKRPGRFGDVWMLPDASCVVLWSRRESVPISAPASAPEPGSSVGQTQARAEVTSVNMLVESVQQLVSKLDSSQRQIEAAEVDRRRHLDLVVSAELAQAELDRIRRALPARWRRRLGLDPDRSL